MSSAVIRQAQKITHYFVLCVSKWPDISENNFEIVSLIGQWKNNPSQIRDSHAFGPGSWLNSRALQKGYLSTQCPL